MSDFRIFHILERLNGAYLVYLVASLDLGSSSVFKTFLFQPKNVNIHFNF